MWLNEELVAGSVAEPINSVQEKTIGGGEDKRDRDRQRRQTVN